MVKTLFYISDALINSGPLPKVDASKPDFLNKFLNLLFITIGALALLMIVVAGFRLVISGDEPDKVASARRMIVCAIVGLVLAGSAALIVNVVLSKTS